MAKATMRLCPNCGSPHHHAESDISVFTGNSPIYICDRCHFQGLVFPSVELEKVEAFKKRVPNKRIKKEKPGLELSPWMLLGIPIALLLTIFLFLVFGVLVIILPIVGVVWYLTRERPPGTIVKK